MKFLESFFWGVIAAFGALFLEIAFSTVYQITSSSGKEIQIGFLISTLPAIALISLFEETAKLLVIARKVKSFFSGKNALLGPLLAGIGFSLVEIFLISVQKEAGLRNIIDTFILHSTTALIIGYFFLRSEKNIFLTGAKSLVLSWAVHFGYNFLVIKTSENTDWLVIAYLLILLVIDLALWCFFREACIRKEYAL